MWKSISQPSEKHMAKPRQPSKQNASRAGRDMRGKDPKARKEAAEVLALIARRKKRR